MSKRTPTLLGSIVGLFSIFLFVAAIGSPQTPYKIFPVTVTHWNEMLTDVKSQPGMKCKDSSEHQYICDSASPPTIWVFTQPGHPAHPAASRGVMVFHGDAIDIDRTGYYAGDRPAFISWMHAFEILDTRQVETWRNMVGH
jgi:hypothetical protein